MKKIKSFLLLVAFIFMKVISYAMFIVAGMIVMKQAPNPDAFNFLFNVFCAFILDFWASQVDQAWKKSMEEAYDNN
jgi:hypothetical protein